MEKGKGETEMYEYRRKVQYHETDKMGIAHHANYIKWMEEARIALLESIGLPFQRIEAAGVVSPVVGVSVEYKTPCTFGDEIVVAVWARKYTGVKLEVSYTMKNAATGALVAAAGSAHCFMKDGRVVSLKRVNPEMHEILTQALPEAGE